MIISLRNVSVATVITVLSITGSWQEELKQKIASNIVPDWMRTQIDADLATFSGGITQQMIDAAYAYSRDIGHFTIIDGKVQSAMDNKTLLLGRGFSRGGAGHPSLIDKRLVLHKSFEDIASVATLPALEFLVILTDGVVDTVPQKGPYFAFSKHATKNNNIIALPDPIVLGTCFKLQEEVARGNQQWPWNKKKKKAFWRGGTNEIPFLDPVKFKDTSRFKLVAFSKQNPTLLDARFVGLLGCKEARKWLMLNGYIGRHVTIEQHIPYAYQIQIDGFTAAWARMYWQMHTNCVMLKQTSNNIQWYYQALQPYVHYVPFKNDVSDLAEAMTWADEHPVEVQQIIENANTFARDNLGYADMLYYLYLLLTKYASLQTFTPLPQQPPTQTPPVNNPV